MNIKQAIECALKYHPDIITIARKSWGRRYFECIHFIRSQVESVGQFFPLDASGSEIDPGHPYTFYFDDLIADDWLGDDEWFDDDNDDNDDDDDDKDYDNGTDADRPF